MPDDPPSSPIQPFRPLPDRTWRERVDDVAERMRALDSVGRAVVAVLAAAAVAVAAWFLLRPTAAGSAPEDFLPRASAAPASASAPPPTSAAVVVVQAAGAVVRPGLYRLPPNSRVDDLVQAAGGLAPDADPDRVNLAALLSDGQRVYIPRIGEAVPAASDPATEGASSGPIDLNAATLAQLDALPGIGPATAQAIVDYRSQHGPFHSVDDLLDVRGIGPSKLEQIRGLVRV